MNHIDFFKLQAKNLFRDYKTQFVDESGSVPIYDYKPKYFDINGIFVDFDWDEENLSLMKIQHIFAVLVGFESWADLVNASEAELELAKLLFDNQHKISLDDWQMYIAGAEGDNNTTFDTESRIEIFKAVFANVDGHHNPFGDYRLHKKPDSEREIKKPHPVNAAIGGEHHGHHRPIECFNRVMLDFDAVLSGINAYYLPSGLNIAASSRFSVSDRAIFQLFR